MEKEVIQEMRIDEIDKEIITRFNQYGFDVTFLNHKFTGNKTTHYYVINGEKYFSLNYKNESKTLSGNGYVKKFNYNDPKNAIIENGRGNKSFGKRIDLSKTGNFKNEQFDYIIFLLLQVIKGNDTMSKELRGNILPLEIDQSFATLCTQKRLDGNMYPTLLQQIQVVADEIPGLAVHYSNTDIDTGDLRVTVNGGQPLLQVNVINQGFIIALLCELEELNNFGNKIAIIFNAEINPSFPELTRFDVDNEFLNNHQIVTTVLRFVINRHINDNDGPAKK